jgi:ankyrin repeat protein
MTNTTYSKYLLAFSCLTLLTQNSAASLQSGLATRTLKSCGAFLGKHLNPLSAIKNHKKLVACLGVASAALALAQPKTRHTIASAFSAARSLIAKTCEKMSEFCRKISTQTLLFNKKDRVKDNTDVNNYSSPTSLHDAVNNGDIATINLLCRQDAFRDFQDLHGNTPLHLAVYNKNTDILNILCAARAKQNIQNKEKRTPLHLAAQTGCTDIVKSLCKNNADTNATGLCNYTPLHWAARMGYADIVKLLCDAGANKNATTDAGNTPLHLAVQCGHIEVVTALRDAGATMNAENNGHETPYQIAVEILKSTGYGEKYKQITDYFELIESN